MIDILYIEPDNFAIGYSNPSKIYLLDFGLAKKYRSSKTLEQRPMVKNLRLTGTARYASVNALKGYDQSRRDDLESVGYVLAYLLRGSLPWQGIVVKTKEEKYAKILYKKQYISPEQLLEGFPSELVNYIKYCKHLEYEQEPDYGYLTSLFVNIIKNELNEEVDYKYDWIKNDIDLQKSIRENYITEDGINSSYLNNTSMVNNMNNSTSLLNNNLSIIEKENNINKINENLKNKNIENNIKNEKLGNKNIENNIQNENKDTNYYEQVLDENKLDKRNNKNDIDKDNEEDENNKGGRKRRHAACCISF